MEAPERVKPMADAFHRNPGDQATYGYRQLPGSGPARGPELKTMVYGTIGVALGIVVGTLIADGSWRSMNPLASHQLVRAGTSAPAVAGRPGTQAAQNSTPVHQAAIEGGSQQAAAQKPSATITSSLAATPDATKPSAAAPVSTAAATSTVSRTSTPAAMTPVAKPSTPSHPAIAAKTENTAKTSTVAQPSASTKPATSAKMAVAQKVSAAHKRRLARKLAAKAKYVAWRKLHPRHRLHGHLRAAVPTKLLGLVAKPKLADALARTPAPAPFTFMVEGSVSIANYDAANGIVDTYEGETFALDKRASEGRTISWLDYPADVRYRCDQSWNCTLFHGGVVVVNAKRTK